MRNSFRGYYKPNKEEFAQLWNDCIFSFDANILLNIYRYTPEARERFFEILDKFEERVWVTHQAAYEYHRNRISVISNQLKPYGEIQNCLDKSLKQLQEIVEQYNKRHSFSTFIDSKQIVRTIDSSHKRVKRILRDATSEYPDLISQDHLCEKLSDLFDGKVGDFYTEEKLSKIYKEAEERFKNSLPPGYLDSRNEKKKQPPDCYGDVLVWFQLIDHVKVESKPIVFVTDETGEDWWLKHQGRTIGPRPELRQEMFSKAGAEFYLYTGDQFLDHASEFLELTDKPEVIEEARDVRSQEREREKIAAVSSSLATEIKNLYKTTPDLNCLSEQIRLSGLKASSIISEQLRGLPDLRASSSIISEQLRGLHDLRASSSIISEQLRGLLGLKSSSIISEQLRGLPEFTHLANLSKQLEQEESRLAEEGELEE